VGCPEIKGPDAQKPLFVGRLGPSTGGGGPLLENGGSRAFVGLFAIKGKDRGFEFRRVLLLLLLRPWL